MGMKKPKDFLPSEIIKIKPHGQGVYMVHYIVRYPDNKGSGQFKLAIVGRDELEVYPKLEKYRLAVWEKRQSYGLHHN
jgi:hypothetical protein